MPLTIILIAMLLTAGLYAVIARHRLRLQLPQMWHIMRTHRLAAGMLAIYSVGCGLLLVTLRVSPLHVLLFLSGELTWDTASVAVLVALPLAAGVYGGWWLERSDPSPPGGRQIIDRGFLTGLGVMALPALFAAVGLGLATWMDGTVDGGWIRMVAGALLWGGLWAAAILALGMVLGTLGALLGATVYRVRHRGGPTASAGVS
ncbi:MAG TPA: hypothetical protein VFU22_10960 [Roseiflexaceae bacterium]|nr:hypothetical protein [Roseiflexaceae bacterium]